MAPASRRFTMRSTSRRSWAEPMLSPTRSRCLAALAGCVTAGIATNADMFGVPIDEMSIELEADVDARGMSGTTRACATA